MQKYANQQHTQNTKLGFVKRGKQPLSMRLGSKICNYTQ